MRPEEVEVVAHRMRIEKPGCPEPSRPPKAKKPRVYREPGQEVKREEEDSPSADADFNLGVMLAARLGGAENKEHDLGDVEMEQPPPSPPATLTDGREQAPSPTSQDEGRKFVRKCIERIAHTTEALEQDAEAAELQEPTEATAEEPKAEEPKAKELQVKLQQEEEVKQAEKEEEKQGAGDQKEEEDDEKLVWPEMAPPVPIPPLRPPPAVPLEAQQRPWSLEAVRKIRTATGCRKSLAGWQLASRRFARARARARARPSPRTRHRDCESSV